MLTPNPIIESFPIWVQEQLNNVPYISSDPELQIEEIVPDKVYGIKSRGFNYTAIHGRLNIR